MRKFIHNTWSKAALTILACVLSGVIAANAVYFFASNRGLYTFDDMIYQVSAYEDSLRYTRESGQLRYQLERIMQRVLWYVEQGRYAEIAADKDIPNVIFELNSGEDYVYELVCSFVNSGTGMLEEYIYTNAPENMDGYVIMQSDDEQYNAIRYNYNVSDAPDGEERSVVMVVQMTLAFERNYIDARQQEFDAAKYACYQLMIRLAVCAVVMAASIVLLCVASGRRGGGEMIRSRIFTDVALALLAGYTFCGLLSSVTFAQEMYYDDAAWLVAVLFGVFIGVFTAGGLFLLAHIVRNGKNKKLFRYTLIRTVCSGAYTLLRGVYHSSNLIKMALVFVVGLGILTMIPYVGIVTVPLAAWLLIRKLGSITELQKTVLDAEVEKRMRSERLKTELISNVSHDIRTPLTSVITYVELLRGEETDNENIKKYAAIIAQKAGRLKILTDALFEASKAASGNVPVNIERVDVCALMTQGLGELNEQITQSGLDFRVSVPKEPIYASADGKLLWRAVENLLSNVFKYALHGSRVYIDAECHGDMAEILIRNISANELNIPAEELTERFKRGDDSRSTDGSGLGLSIAKSLTEAMHGRLELSIDGDLFKARVVLRSAES